VISHLLTAIAQTLQTGLQEHLPQASEPIAVRGGTLVLPQKLPYIRLLPGKVTFPHNGRDNGTLAPQSTQPQSIQLVMVREFQQEFFVEIYDDSIANLELYSSLILGILFTSHDALLQTYNQGQQNLPKTEYHAAPFHTVHTLNQMQLLEGLPIATETALGLQLRGTAIGQITITQVLPKGAAPIESVSITQPQGSSSLLTEKRDRETG
jgi:hypothetical protein